MMCTSIITQTFFAGSQIRDERDRDGPGSVGLINYLVQLLAQEYLIEMSRSLLPGDVHCE